MIHSNNQAAGSVRAEILIKVTGFEGVPLSGCVVPFNEDITGRACCCIALVYSSL